MTSIEDSGFLSRKLESQPPGGNGTQQKSIFDSQDRSNAAFGGLDSVGNDKLVGRPTKLAVIGDDEGAFELNLLDVPLAAAAKAVLGDALGVNYSIDSRVQGTVTIQTPKPVGQKRLLSMFRGALKGLGASIIGEDGVFRIVPSGEAGGGAAQLDGGESELENPGNRSKIVQVRHVSAAEIARNFRPFMSRYGRLIDIKQTNTIIIA